MKDWLNKITGNVVDEYDHLEDIHTESGSVWGEESSAERDQMLPVDVYEDGHNLHITAFIPGIEPSTMDIDITRDTVTIRGSVHRTSTIKKESEFQRELGWGTYARSISLPREISIEQSNAHSANGVLHITLPKIDKDRRTKLQVQ